MKPKIEKKIEKIKEYLRINGPSISRTIATAINEPERITTACLKMSKDIKMGRPIDHTNTHEWDLA